MPHTTGVEFVGDPLTREETTPGMSLEWTGIEPPRKLKMLDPHSMGTGRMITTRIEEGEAGTYRYGGSTFERDSDEELPSMDTEIDSMVDKKWVETKDGGVQFSILSPDPTIRSSIEIMSQVNL